MDRNEPPTCVNCKERHPANYRGCEVAKELQKIRNLRKKTGNKKSSVQSRIAVDDAPKVHQKLSQVSQTVKDNKPKGKTHAEVVKKPQPKLKENKSDQVLQEVLNKLNSLQKGMEEQKESNKKIFDKFSKQEAINKQMFQRFETMESNMEKLSKTITYMKYKI